MGARNHPVLMGRFVFSPGIKRLAYQETPSTRSVATLNPRNRLLIEDLNDSITILNVTV